jgi:hypothetical protein
VILTELTLVDDILIADTAAALDRALARIAIDVAGSPQRAEALLACVGRGERDEFAAAFLSQGAAMMRARLLLADAGRRPALAAA